MKKARSLMQIFSVLPDPRKRNHSQHKHKLVDIVGLAICAVVGGANNWVEIELFCQYRARWLQEVFGSDLQIPSHDTFWRVFALLDPRQFESLFREWVEETYERVSKEVINIDGKSLSGTVKNYPQKTDPIHIVNAWATESGLVLGQNKSHVKGLYERDQMVELLKLLHLKGCLVTIDAMGTTQASCEEILSKKGHYVLAVKKNQKLTYKQIEALTRSRKEKGQVLETAERGHSRREKRHYKLIRATPNLVKKWPGLKSLGTVTVERYSPDTFRNGKTRLKKKTETRYYISSLPSRHVRKFAHAVRSHWSIENKLHWGLDVAFDEDGCRSVIKNGAENFALLRRIAFNIINQDDSFAASKRQKRLRAGWDNKYLEKIVFG